VTIDLDKLEALARAAGAAGLHPESNDGSELRALAHAVDADVVLALVAEVREMRARVVEIEGFINTPRTDDFFAVVRVEAAHQIERWGVEHDAGKRSEDWIALFVYLLGKATKAHFDGNTEKLKHHVVTVAAVSLNWLRNLNGESTAMRPGVAAGSSFIAAYKAWREANACTKCWAMPDEDGDRYHGRACDGRADRVSTEGL
jgi:hypothetical protein